jgi:hypothetical protein
MWLATDSTPAQPCGWDRYSLDSAENVYLALMVARRDLEDIPMERIGVFAAWDFKKRRFNLVAKALGIISRFYFHGFAPATRANAGALAVAGEEKFLKSIEAAQDFLLLSTNAEEIRRRRFCGDPGEPDYDDRVRSYPNRLGDLRPQFAPVLDCLDGMREGRTDSDLANLHHVFASTVVGGASARVV